MQVYLQQPFLTVSLSSLEIFLQCINYSIVKSLVECVEYMTLSDPTRAQSYPTVRGNDLCDEKLSGWYRFDGEAGDRMADSCVPFDHCGGVVLGWLKGGHPTEANGVVQRKVCFSWFSGSNTCCKWSIGIDVRNCGDFYVYKFRSPPLCSARYCGNG